MRRLVGFVGVVAATLSVSAAAETVVTISKSQQRLVVTVDGVELHRWPVSTGRRGLDTPSGTFRPIRFERQWYSRKYDMSPMPYSVFFHGGYALHGTTDTRRLGHAASHGCVRLLPVNAAALFALLRKEGKGDTRIVVTDAALPAARMAKAEIEVPLPALHKPEFAALPVTKLAARDVPLPAKRAAIEIAVPLPPQYEPEFAPPPMTKKSIEIAVLLPPQFEPKFEPEFEPKFEPKLEPKFAAPPTAKLAARDVPLPAKRVAIEIAVPLPPQFEPKFEQVSAAPREPAKPAVIAALSPPSLAPPKPAAQALAHVPLPPTREAAAKPEPRQPSAPQTETGSFTSAGDEAAVLRGREAWLRSLDRKYGIMR